MCEARIPVRFCMGGDSVAHHGETIGIAPWHLIVSTTMGLPDGMRLTVKLRMVTSDGPAASGDSNFSAGWPA